MFCMDADDEFQLVDGVSNDDIETAKKKKDKVQVFSRSSARSAHKTMQGILLRKVFMTEARIEYVQNMWTQVQAGQSTTTNTPLLNADGAGVDGDVTSPVTDAKRITNRILLVNFPVEQAARIESALQCGDFAIRSETIGQRDWVALMSTAQPKFHVPCEESGDPLRHKPAGEDGKQAKTKGLPKTPNIGGIPQVLESEYHLAEISVRSGTLKIVYSHYTNEHSRSRRTPQACPGLSIWEAPHRCRE